MSEKLIIKNFGPISYVDLDLRKVNVLIGDQGTGKSTVAKLYTLIWNLIYFDIFNDEKIVNSHDPFTAKFLKNLESFDLIRYLKNDSFIQLSTTKFNFLYDNGKVESSNPEKYLIKSEDFKKGQYESFLFNYITAERVFISTLSDALFGLINLGTKLPQLFSRFGNKFQSARKEKEVWNYKEILNANYAHINGIDYVIMSNGEKIFLTDASTGLQGAMPMLVVFDSIVENIGNDSRSQINRKNLLIVEEPELNLFPETQKKVVEYIIGNNFCIPARDKNSITDIDDVMTNEYFINQLIITTHSPYILSSLNNLMYAYEIGKINSEEVENKIPKKYWLNPNDVSVYQLLIGGTCENIMDEELKQIKVEKIDEISEVLSTQWHQLADLNFAK
jgi:predicted ATP-dependent endonuclease of OLD family